MVREIKLYYTSDGNLFTQVSKNKVPLITKASRYAYKLILVTPVQNTNKTFYALFEKSNGEVTQDYLMSYENKTENVIVNNEEQIWYVYSCFIQDDVLTLPTYDKTNNLKIGFKVTFNTGQQDENGANIIGTKNYIPYNATCVYAITSRQNTNDLTSIQVVIEYLQANYYTKQEVENLIEESITTVLSEPA